MVLFEVGPLLSSAFIKSGSEIVLRGRIQLTYFSVNGGHNKAHCFIIENKK
jgi:hypothetical protein